MRRYLVFLLLTLLFPLLVNGQLCMDSVGIAPFAVNFNAMDSGSGVVQPPLDDDRREYADLYYSWDFGDPGHGNWPNSNKSKNHDIGYLACHVYDYPGNYTVKLTVKDTSGNTNIYTQQITVQDPEEVFSGTNTICVSSSGNFTGAPFGSQQITTTNILDIQEYISTGNRILLKRGDSWTTSGQLSFTNLSGPFIIGAYGDGVNQDERGIYENAPIINLTGVEGGNFITYLNANTFKLMDLHFIGDETYHGCFGGTCGVNYDMLHYRLHLEGFELPVAFSHWEIDGHDRIKVISCHIHDSALYEGYLGSENIVIMGNFAYHSGYSHVFRVWQAYKGVISHNIIHGSSISSDLGRHGLKLHGPLEDFMLDPSNGSHLEHRTQYVVIYDNVFGTCGPWSVMIAPTDESRNAIIQDILVEANRFHAGYGTMNQNGNLVQRSLTLAASYVTVRNNLFDGIGGNDSYEAVCIHKYPNITAATGNRIFNNTVYKSDFPGGNGNYYGVAVDSGANTVIQNNLIVYSSTPPLSSETVDDNGMDTYSSNNMLLNESCFVDPDNADYFQKNFYLLDESTPIESGTQVPILHDYVLTSRPIGNGIDLGAYENTSASTNSLPTASSSTLATNEDNDLTIVFSDLDYNDTDSDEMTQIQITVIPNEGVLFNDANLDGIVDGGEMLAQDGIVSKAHIDGNRLKFKPDSNENGTPYASFNFKVHDGTSYSMSAYTITIDVASENDLPTSADITITINENTPHTFSESDFPFNDIDGDSFAGIRVETIPDAGTLKYDGNNVTPGMECPNIILLVFTPVPQTNGSLYTSFSFSVKDNWGAFSDTSNSCTINVSSVSYVPSVVTNTGCTIMEGGLFKITDNILKSSDPDSPTYSLQYTILSGPYCGTLSIKEALPKKLSSQQITFTQNDIANGKVTYTHNGSETEVDSFAFKVSDQDGGESVENIFKISVIGVNDPPVFTGIPEIIANEDEEYIISKTSLKQYVDDVDTPDSALTVLLNSHCEDIKIAISDTAFHLGYTSNWSGCGQLSFIVNDGETTIDTVLNVTVNPVNDLPVFYGLPAGIEIVNPDAAFLDLTNVAKDEETPDSLLVFHFTVEPDSISIGYDESLKLMTLTGKGTYSGEVNLTITVLDNDGGSDSKTISVIVKPDMTGLETISGLPTDYVLYQNYPNPFNPSTKIRYGIPSTQEVNNQHVSLKIYDMLGKVVAVLVEKDQSPGYYEYTLDASNLASGIYFYRLITESFTDTRKMILLR